MPLFFCISGFFAYKPIAYWTIKIMKQKLFQKFQAQIVCTIFFYALLAFVRGQNLVGWIDCGFWNYWFTVVLFQMFLVYFCLILISKIIRINIVLPGMVLAAIGLLCAREFLGLGMGSFSKIMDMFNTVEVLFYMQYFAVGMFFQKYKDKVFLWFSRDWIKTILILSVIVGYCLMYSDFMASMPGFLRFYKRIVLPYIILIALICSFYNFREYFNKSGIISNTMAKIGSRTLDIYMLHWFFLFPIPALKEIIEPNYMAVPQLIIGLCLSMIVIMLCLTASTWIRSSQFLSSWLFGVRRRHYTQATIGE